MLCLNLFSLFFSFPSLFFHPESPGGSAVLYQPAVDIWFDTLGQSTRTYSCPQQGSCLWYLDASEFFKVALYVLHKQPPHFLPLSLFGFFFSFLTLSHPPFSFFKKNPTNQEAKIVMITLRSHSKSNKPRGTMTQLLCSEICHWFQQPRGWWIVNSSSQKHGRRWSVAVGRGEAGTVRVPSPFRQLWLMNGRVSPVAQPLWKCQGNGAALTAWMCCRGTWEGQGKGDWNWLWDKVEAQG